MPVYRTYDCHTCSQTRFAEFCVCMIDCARMHILACLAPGWNSRVLKRLPTNHRTLQYQTVQQTRVMRNDCNALCGAHTGATTTINCSRNVVALNPLYKHTILYTRTRMLTKHLQLNAIHTPVASDPLSFTVLYSNEINHIRTGLFFLGVYDTQEPI